MPTASLLATRSAKAETAPVSADLDVIKTRQRVAWSSGNYAVVGTTLQIVGEELCEALDLRAGRKVLDVAAGNGMASLAAARRWCDVVSTDYVSSLLERGRARAPTRRIRQPGHRSDRQGSHAGRGAGPDNTVRRVAVTRGWAATGDIRPRPSRNRMAGLPPNEFTVV